MRKECIIVLWRTQRIIIVVRKTESEIATGRELSVEVSSKVPGRNKQNLFVRIALSIQYEITRLPLHC